MNDRTRDWLDNGADIDSYIDGAISQAQAQGVEPRSREDYAGDAVMFLDGDDRAMVTRNLAEWRTANC